MKKRGAGGCPFAWNQRSISHNLHLQPPVARAIKFAKENALPAAKYQLAACHVDDLTAPTSRAFTWESEFPSLCRYGPVAGINRSSAPSMSSATSGSAHSLMVMAAVV